MSHSSAALSAKKTARRVISAPPVRITPLIVITFAVILLNLLVDAIWPNPYSSFFATVIYMFSVAQIFAINPVAVVLLLPFIILHVSALVSLNFIEGGTYMKELAYPGSASTAAASYVVYVLIFLLVGVMTFNRLCLKYGAFSFEKGLSAFHGLPALVRWAPVLSGVLIVTYLLASGLVTGFPFLTGTDRFLFRRLSASVLTLDFLNFKILIAASLGTGAIFADDDWKKRIHHIVFASYLLTSVLYGDKFFIIVNSTIIYLMPSLIRNPLNTYKSVRKIAPVAICAVIALLGLTVFIYSDYGSSDLSKGFDRLSDRIGGQGQLWFMAVKDSTGLLKFDLKTVSDNLRSIFSVPAADFVFQHRLAAFYFVEKYSPQDLYNAAVHNDGWVTPTMLFEAYGLVTFGYLGLVFQMILAGFAAGLVIYYLSHSFASGNMFVVLLPAMLMTGMGYLLSQATLYSVIGISIFKIYAAMLVAQFLISAVVRNMAIDRRFRGTESQE